ncbi:dentin sialophosphoprotein-like [Lolium rigidum]|uniref:dentin sialophosphoprotein-like n=1 Tax=Lolium rigidum TaxID=89674 RepID=UPI001F5C63AE|nr:dentin sialophosphoprotein-like [Lolium rigidum]
MEAVAAAAAMVDLNTLSRRELQALCKLNGVRANMTNLAMVEALHSLPSVDGIDQIGTTLCLPTPGKSAVKSVLRTAAPSDQQQQGSPLPRGRRVSVKSPEAIRMDAEDEDDEAKRELIREIVRTPGVALRSTSRRARATPAPLPTPAAGTLRRSQRSTVRKAAAPVEETEVSIAKRSTRRTAIPKVAIDFDQEEEDAAVTKGVTEEKCDDPEEEEGTKLPEEGNSKGGEPEQEEEGAAAIEEEEKLVNPEKSAPLSAMEDSPILGVLSKVAPEPDMNNVANSSTEAREVLCNWSPVRGIADGINNASEDKEDAAVVVLGEAVEEDAFNSTVEAAASPNKIATAAMTEKEIAVVEINNSNEDKEDVAVEVPGEAVEEDAFNSTVEAAAAPSKIVTAAMSEKEIAVDESPEEYVLVGESSEEADLTDQSSEVDDLDQDEADLTEQSSEVIDQDDAGLTEQSSEVDDLDQDEEDMLKADRTIDEESDETIEVAAAPNKMDPAAVTEMEVAVDEVPQADLTDDESADEYDQDGESSEGADLSEESSEVDMLKADQTVDEESDDTIEVSGSIDVNFDSDEEEEQLKMPGTGEETDEVEESDSLSGDEDDFSGDLSSEFDDVLNFSDAEAESDSSPVALKGIDAAAAAAAASSAAKTVESVITEETEVSSEGDVVSQHVVTVVESLDKVVITEKKEVCAKEKKQLKVGKEMSLRKLKSAYKESLIAAKEGKKLTIATDDGNRVALAELDDNADC